MLNQWFLMYLNFYIILKQEMLQIKQNYPSFQFLSVLIAQTSHSLKVCFLSYHIVLPSVPTTPSFTVGTTRKLFELMHAKDVQKNVRTTWNQLFLRLLYTYVLSRKSFAGDERSLSLSMKHRGGECKGAFI